MCKATMKVNAGKKRRVVHSVAATITDNVRNASKVETFRVDDFLMEKWNHK